MVRIFMGQSSAAVCFSFPEEVVGQIAVSCAAIRTPDGKVYSVARPGRHHHVIASMAEAGLPAPIRGEQGFVLNTGTFVGRREARILAENAGQIRAGMGRFDELYSEDMW